MDNLISAQVTVDDDALTWLTSDLTTARYFGGAKVAVDGFTVTFTAAQAVSLIDWARIDSTELCNGIADGRLWIGSRSYPVTYHWEESS